MSMRPPHMNGGWPDLPAVPPPIDELPPNATPMQVMRALGSTLLMFGQLWPRVVQALEYLRASLHRVEEAQLTMPPMRAQIASSHDLAKAVGHDVAKAFEREQRNPSTPPPTGTTVAHMVEERVQVELLRLKNAAMEKAEAERQAAEQERQALAAINARNKSKAFWTLVIAAITTASAIVVAAAEHFAR